MQIDNDRERLNTHLPRLERFDTLIDAVRVNTNEYYELSQDDIATLVRTIRRSHPIMENVPDDISQLQYPYRVPTRDLLEALQNCDLHNTWIYITVKYYQAKVELFDTLSN